MSLFQIVESSVVTIYKKFEDGTLGQIIDTSGIEEKGLMSKQRQVFTRPQLMFTLEDALTSVKIKYALEALSSVESVLYETNSLHGAVLFKSQGAASLLKVVQHQGDVVVDGVAIHLHKTTSQMELILMGVISMKKTKKAPIQFKKTKALRGDQKKTGAKGIKKSSGSIKKKKASVVKSLDGKAMDNLLQQLMTF